MSRAPTCCGGSISFGLLFWNPELLEGRAPRFARRAERSRQRPSDLVRILFLSHYFPPEGNAPATRVHALAKHWVRAGHEVTVVTCAPNVPSGVVYDGYRNRLVQSETIDGIRALRVWTYLAANRGSARRIVNYLSYMTSAVAAAPFLPRPDVVVATSPQFFCGWAGVLVSRLRRVPLVLEIRDIWPESIVAVGAMRSRGLMAGLERIERAMYAAASRIVTVGDGYREQLEARGADRGRIAVIPNGVDRETFVPRAPEPEIRVRFGLEDRFVCGYVGTVGMASGLDTVLRAARLLQASGVERHVFLIVGDGAEREALERSAAADRLDNVVFTGRLDKREIPAVLATIDVCLVHLRDTPLFSTVLPSKLFEAAAMARPVILGVRGQAARLVEEAGCGVCMAPENEHELVRILERLAADPELCQRMGRAGEAYFGERFDRAELAARYLALLQEVAGAAASPAGRRAEAGTQRPAPANAGCQAGALKR